MIHINNKRQITGIRKSCALAAECLRYIASYVKSGVKTIELNNLLHEFIINNNAIPATLGYEGFPASCCISVNEVICHGIPSEYVLKDGDIVNIDVTTILDGFFGDTSTMFAIGEISSEASRLLKITKECMDVGIREVYPTNYFGNIGYEINKLATMNCFGVIEKFAGHGTGIAFHTSPQIPFVAPKNSGARMWPGMVFTVEPMLSIKSPDVVILEDKWTAVTADGLLSAQYEETILVTPKGFEILTR